ncbi:MAG TPA: hypothetical protein VGE01_15280 [Fimbriimonas sp.]
MSRTIERVRHDGATDAAEVPLGGELFKSGVRRELKDFPFQAPLTVRLLFVVDLALGAAYGVSHLVAKPGSLLRMFLDLDGERNLPTWYSSIQLFLIAFCFARLAKRHVVWLHRVPWPAVLMSAGFCFLSLDEFSQIHEGIGHFYLDRMVIGADRSESTLGVTGVWPFILGPILLLGLILMARVIHGLVKAAWVTTLLFMAGAVLFVGSAAGVGLLANVVPPDMKHVQILFEEVGEMMGATLMLWASLRVLVRERRAARKARLQAKAAQYVPTEH